ncbi:MAG TPA: DUF2141 domain-containing protein [Geminicoccaceae bacterium]|nr:DUF2141 domain-containing protein [Geminicoccaceae bacterium]
MDFWRRLLIAAGLLCAAGRPGDPAAAAEVTVTVAGLRNGDGEVACALFATEEGFLEAGRELAGRRVPAAEGSVVVTFEDVPPGDYAVVAYHDENGNRELDRNILGLPIEGLGFSNDQRPSAFGPPTFDAVKVPVGAGPAAFTIEIHY